LRLELHPEFAADQRWLRLHGSRRVTR